MSEEKNCANCRWNIPLRDYDASCCDNVDSMNWANYTSQQEVCEQWEDVEDGRSVFSKMSGMNEKARMTTISRVTDHAVRRTKERIGIPKRISEKNAEKAMQRGIRHSDTTGSLNRYITALYWKNQTANNVRIYCDSVYIFHNDTLITIFPLPQKYRKLANKLQKEKNHE